MECAPPWLVRKAVSKEHNDNCADAYKAVEEAKMQSGSNVIGSHIVYKIMTEEDAKMRLKARICPHSNHDKER